MREESNLSKWLSRYFLGRVFLCLFISIVLMAVSGFAILAIKAAKGTEYHKDPICQEAFEALEYYGKKEYWSASRVMISGEEYRTEFTQSDVEQFYIRGTSVLINGSRARELLKKAKP